MPPKLMMFFAQSSGLSTTGVPLVSQLLTLYTTPVVYLCLDRLSRRFNLWRKTRRRAVARQSKEIIVKP